MSGGGGYSFGSLFAGIGGICIGFSQAGFRVKWSNEIDKYACQTYRYNERYISPGLDITEGDIRGFYPTEHVDVLGGGFPCQPYSIAGRMEGLNDSRGRGQPMFEEILRIARDIGPRVIFLENVGNLMSFDNGETFDYLMGRLEEAGYPWHYSYVLNSKDYSGIPQFRNRIYIVAFNDYEDAKIFVNTHLEGPPKIPQKVFFSDIVSSSSSIALKYYYDQNDPAKCISKRYLEHFVPYVTEEGVFYQYRRNFMRRNQNGLCPALTASMGGGGHNVPIIKDDRGIRKLTPEECLRIQGFPEWFEFPYDMADSHKYKQVGNSVTVPVIKSFADMIRNTLELSDSRR